MPFEVKKAARTGFCFGVKRAIELLQKAASEYGSVEALGAIVHNHQVTESLASHGVTVAASLEAMKGPVVAIGSHGVSPQMEAEMRSRFKVVIDTTCPFVKRAQTTAARFAADGYNVVVYGESEHPEVKGILGHCAGTGIATMDAASLPGLQPPLRRLGVLSQTTQIPAGFIEFSKRVVELMLTRDVELRLADTICHDIHERQQAAMEIARQVDLMLVVGSHTSANTNHLTELCRGITQAYLVESERDISLSWLVKCRTVGVTSGSSTPEQTVEDVIARLKILD